MRKILLWYRDFCLRDLLGVPREWVTGRVKAVRSWYWAGIAVTLMAFAAALLNVELQSNNLLLLVPIYSAMAVFVLGIIFVPIYETWKFGWNEVRRTILWFTGYSAATLMIVGVYALYVLVM